MGEKVGSMIQVVASFIGGFAFAYPNGWKLTGVLSIFIPVVALTIIIMSIFMVRKSTEGQVAYAKAGNVVEETVGSIKTVASFTGEEESIQKFRNMIEKSYTATLLQALVSGFGLGVILMVMFGCYGLAYLYGNQLIEHEDYHAEQVVNITVSIMSGALSLGQSISCLNAFASAQATTYKMFDTIKRQSKIDPYDNNGITIQEIEGVIEFKTVCFKYPTRPEPIIANFTLCIPRGKTVALVGQSGSGKSTIINLTQRLFDPDLGEILINGVNLKNIQLGSLRRKIGLIAREPVIFTCTLKENVAYGKENATDEEIITAIKSANATKFIQKLPQGIHTMLGVHGTHLSNGEKQRIAFARMLLKNPEILLLDEASNALDGNSERMIQEAFLKLSSNRTTVVVARWLTTIRNADLIVVLHGGKVVQEGTHEMLMEDPQGLYSKLVQMQEDPTKKEEGRNATSNIETVLPSSPSPNLRTSDNHWFFFSMPLQLCHLIRNFLSFPSLSLRISDALPSPTSPSFRTSDALPSPPSQSQSFTTSDIELALPPSTRHAHNIPNEVTISFKRLAFFFLPFTIVGCLAGIINGILFPLFGLFLSSATSSLFESPVSKLKSNWAHFYFLMGALMLILGPLQSFFLAAASGKLIQTFNGMVFEKIVHQDIGWFDDPENSSGAIGARFSATSSTFKNLVDDLALLVQKISTIVTGLIVAFTANSILSLVILALLPFMQIEGYIQEKFMRQEVDAQRLMYEEASQVASDAVKNIRTVASFGLERKVMNLYQKVWEDPRKQGIFLALVSSAGFGFSSFALYCTNALCLYVGAILIKHELATFGEVFRVFLAFTISTVSISQSSAMVPNITKAKDSLASIYKFLDSKPRIDSSSNDGTTPPQIDGNIELDNISFNYPSQPNIQVLKGIRLRIPFGKTVALVGDSGSGKSTVIGLINRYYDPMGGRVLLDGIDIRTISVSWLRQQMRLVSQEPVLFNETIRANIVYGKSESATEEDIVAAATAANAHNFISSLPQGYDTLVGERGGQLSGAQKQRIAIARAILKDPKILLLDDATSALDSESEIVVQEALDRLKLNRTTVVVAHRLATIKGADMIAVLKKGVILEQGSHETLINIKDGAYASLIALQSSSSARTAA